MQPHSLGDYQQKINIARVLQENRKGVHITEYKLEENESVCSGVEQSIKSSLAIELPTISSQHVTCIVLT